MDVRCCLFALRRLSAQPTQKVQPQLVNCPEERCQKRVQEPRRKLFGNRRGKFRYIAFA